MPNLVLGLSAIPPHVFNFGSEPMSDLCPWIYSIFPAVLADQWTGTIDLRRITLTQPQRNPSSELLASLYALHATLIPVLHSITTTSLCPAELHLLSISLLNLLFLSRSPFSRILATILWVGGLGILLLCAPVIRWGVTLARVPRWRFRRAARVVQARQSFVRGLFESVRRTRSGARKTPVAPDIVPSDADDDLGEAVTTTANGKGAGVKPLNLESIQSFVRNLLPDKDTVRSAVEWRGADPFDQRNGAAKPEKRRRNTLPTATAQPTPDSHEKRKHRRPRTLPISYFLSLTPDEAARRRWLYAGYLYLVVLSLILGPIRTLVSRLALHGHEPFGWAVGYLGGDLRDLRFRIVSSGLDSWIPLPPLRDSCASSKHASWAVRLRDDIIGPANTRLLIGAYSLAVLFLGLLALHRLASLVEVDTRRKVFHGVMVLILIPTIPLDAPFLALALALTLCVFLLLDLLRASQLPPLSRPLAAFLAPFVDGRDLRGPVVVSHIFLLVGCAVPLWLGLAAAPPAGAAPWAGWAVGAADPGMLAGAACVGLGDAAASLVGRRWGRRRWAWSGGKSLEGSAAFALAAAAGLAAARLELALLSSAGGGGAAALGRLLAGGVAGAAGAGAAVLGWGARVGAAAGAASLMEAVLTGGNDNVVVPVVLWLYVRALGV
jgi:dolichol kinase